MRIPYVSMFPTVIDETDFKPVSDLEKIIYNLKQREQIYLLYSNYYDGNHDLRLSREKMVNTFGNLFREFADNLMPTVVDSMEERLSIIGFSLENEDENSIIQLPITPNDIASQQQNNSIPNGSINFSSVQMPKREKTVADKAWELWRECRMQNVQSEVHQEALICGDAYVLVWTDINDPSKVRVYPQKANQFYIQENPETGLPEYAGKVWREGNRLRVTLYYPDLIEKYISVDKKDDPKRDSDFVHYEIPDEEWPLPNPYGRVPAFRFSNKSRMGGMGRSELKDVIPIQDALNKAVMDLMVGMEYAALRQRWATGIELPTDPITGKEISDFESGMDKLWHTANDNAKFGEFEAADLNAFIQVHDSLRIEIARITRTPLHYFTIQTGNAPSGAALRTIEKPLVNKCEKAQERFGDVWEDVAEFMLFVAKEISSLGKIQLETNWKPAHSEDEKEDLETAALKEEVGVSKRQILRELGYSDQQIHQMEVEKAARTASDNQQMTQDVITAFDRGNNIGANNDLLNGSSNK